MLKEDKKSLLHSRNYRRYFIALSTSTIGTGIRFIATTWMVLQVTKAPNSAALVLLVEALPGILFSPTIGVLIDRMDRRILAAGLNILQTCIILTIPLASWLGHVSSLQLYLVSFFVATGEITNKTTTLVLVREIVPEDMLLVANTTSGISNQLGLALGAAIAGVVIAQFSAMAALLLYAVFLIVSALLYLNILKVYKDSDYQATTVRRGNLFVAEVKDGINYIKQHTEIIPLYLVMLLLVAILRTINSLLPPFAESTLRVGGQGFGYIDSSFAVGAVVGNLILPRLRQRYGTKLIMNVGMVGLACSLSIFAFASNLWTAMLAYSLVGVTYEVWVLYLTLAQEAVELSYQGRVHMTLNFFFYLGSITVYICMSYLITEVSLRWLYIAMALMIAGSLVRRPFFRKEKELKTKKRTEKELVGSPV